MDISTVETLDSYFARTIVETAEMVELMGGPTVIAGMTPTVAITATQLGLTFGRLLTSLDVDSALNILQKR
jgi:rsbT antagonist protein RsbS